MNWKRTVMLGLIIIVAGAAAFVWYRFIGTAPAEPVTHTNGQASSKALLSLLGTLEGLKFDVSFFEDRTYKSLQDFSPDIPVPQTKGSANPFLSP